jgi:hypothetical protein
MAAMCDFDRQAVVQVDPDWERRPRVCDWDRIERRGLVSPAELLAVDWYLGR